MLGNERITIKINTSIALKSRQGLKSAPKQCHNKTGNMRGSSESETAEESQQLNQRTRSLGKAYCNGKREIGNSSKSAVRGISVKR